MSRARKAVMGFATDAGGQVVLTLANLALAPVILAHTSQAQYGFWLTALSVLSYLGLMDLGLGLALTRSIAAEAGRSDAERINQIVGTGVAAFCIVGALFAALGLVASAFISDWFHIPPQDRVEVERAFRIVVMASSAALPLSVFSSVVCGFQQMATDNVVRTSVAFASLLLTILLLSQGFGLMGLALATLFTVLATGVTAAWWAWRYCPGLRLDLRLANRVDFRHLFAFGGYFQLGKVANTVALNADSVVISGAMGAQHVTPYIFTAKLANLFSFTLASKLPAAVFPAMSQMYLNREYETMSSAYLRLSAYAVRLAVIGTSMCLLCTRDFVTLWVGAEQYAGLSLTLVFGYWALQDTISRGTASALYATGQLKAWSFVCLGEAAINLGASVLLVRQYGLVGVALGTSIGKTFTTAWINPILVGRAIELPMRIYVWSGVLRPMLCSLPGVAVTAAAALLSAGEPTWMRLGVLGLLAVAGNVAAFEGVAFLANQRRGAPAAR